MSRSDRVRRTLIAYDVPQDKRRTKIARILEEHGDRIQYSVFVVDLLPSQLIKLKSQLGDTLNRNEDSILLCDLGLVSSLTEEQFSFLGREREITEQGPIII